MNLNLLRESPLNVRDQLMRREKSEFTLHASTKCHVSVDKCASGGDGERKGNDAESMYFKGTLRLCQTKKSAVAVYICMSSTMPIPSKGNVGKPSAPR